VVKVGVGAAESSPTDGRAKVDNVTDQAVQRL
jgi:hypothetical protein